jgi:hypothetical protein
MSRKQPLLFNDREIDKNTLQAVYGQRRGKHDPAATDASATIEKL